MKKGTLWWILGAAVAIAAVVVCLLVFGGDRGPALYRNLDGHLYSINTQSRQPGEDGLYHLRFARDGEVVELTADTEELVLKIDAMPILGLTADKNGAITQVTPVSTFATVLFENYFLKTVEDQTIHVNTSLAMNGAPASATVGEKTKFYDVSDGNVTEITAADLKPLDAVSAYADLKGNVLCVYVLSHPEESAIYWRISRSYSSSKKQTTQQPDENGLFAIDFYCDGEIVTLQCKDQALVTAIDAEGTANPHFGFTFDDDGHISGIVKSALGIRGLLACESYDITEMGDTVTATELLNNKGLTWTGTVHPECKVFDISDVAKAENRMGQQVDGLQLGDRVTVWTDTLGRATRVYVLNRLVDTPAYFSISRKYDSKTKETTRQPNEDGWYEVSLLKEGDTEPQVYKTQDKALMSYLDSYSSRCLGVVADENNVLQQVYHATCLFGESAWSSGGVVASTTGSIVIRMAYGNAKTTYNGVMMPDCKIYNVSTVGKYGEETTLQVGDYIYAFRQPTGELVQIYVVRRCIGPDTMYYNLDPQYDQKTGKTTRQPDDEGWYHYQLSYQGQTVTMKVGSEELASKLDSYTAVSLETTVDIIEAVHAPNYACGGSEVVKGYTYTGLNEKRAHTATKGETVTTFTLGADCLIYDMTKGGKQVDSLPEGATIVVYTDRNGAGKIVYIY